MLAYCLSTESNPGSSTLDSAPSYGVCESREGGPSPWSPTPMRDTQMKVPVPGFSLVQPDTAAIWEVNQVYKFLSPLHVLPLSSLALSLSITLPFNKSESMSKAIYSEEFLKDIL